MDIHATLDDLRAAGLLTDTEVAAATRRLRSQRSWAKPADVLLLVLGAALLLAGVVFFFAWNWDAMPGLAKLGVVEVALVICAAAAYRATALPRQVLLTAASALVGVFLAVYGQVYQTGADPWTLFATWAALIVPWTLSARFGLCTALLVGLLDTALVQAADPLHLSFDETMVALGLLNAAALAVRESTQHAGRWLREVLLAAALGPLTLDAIYFVVEDGKGGTGLAAYVLAAAAALYWFRSRTPDLAALSLTALSLCILTLTFIGKHLLDSASAITLLLFALTCVAVFAGAVWALRRALPEPVP